MELIHDMFRTILFLGVFAKYNTQNATTNDLIIEKINNCQCVQYYLCNNNSYIITDGKGLIDVRFNKEDKIPCNAISHVCCKLKSDEEVLEPTERRPTYYLSCGQPRTSSLTNTLTPNDNSVPAINGEIPWIASIFQVLSSGENNYKFKCAGSIIHPKVILTATHCVRSSKANSLKVVATGKEIFQDLNTASDNEIRNVVKLIKHENYYSGGLHNDIALLFLDKQFDFTKAYVNSVCLPKIEDNFEGQRCIAMGWGQKNNAPNRTLKKVDVPIIEHQHCEGQLRSTRLGNNFNLDSSFLCAGGEKGKDTCCGDGGGPLVCLKGDSSYVIVGIVSWGIDCGVENVPGVYTNVTYFTDWINTQFNINRDSIDNIL